LSLEELETRLTPATTISIADGSVLEPMPHGTVDMDFTLTRTGDLTSQVTVGFTTVAGTAQPTTDFTPTTGTTTFASGSPSASIHIPVFGNGVFNNPSLTFSVQLTGVVNVVGPPVTLATPADFTAGTHPYSVAVADLNGDGKPDLVIAGNYYSSSSSGVSVLLNTTAPGATTPTFAPAENFATGSVARSVAVADLNGDGKLDLVVVNRNSNSVSVLLNTTAPGATTASFATHQDFATGTDPYSVAIADLNGDGKPDLAVANLSSSSVSVFVNTTAPGASTPTFAPKQDFATPGAFNSVLVAAADVNGDGRPDLITSASGASVLLNTTTPGSATVSFAPNQVVNNSTGFLAVGDLNGDGRPDIVGSAVHGVDVLLNTTAPGAATASFALAGQFLTGTVGSPEAATIADLNGDGKPDIVADDLYGTAVLVNTTAPGAATMSFNSESFTSGFRPFSLAVADLNGDGRPDVVVAHEKEGRPNTPSVSVLLNTTVLGAGTITPDFPQAATAAASSEPFSVAVGDLNGDGLPDLVVTNESSNSVSVFLNTTAPGASTPSFAPKQDFTTGAQPEFVAIGDLNGDGLPDLAVADFGSNSVSVLLNTTAPGATTPSFAAHHDFTTGSNPYSVAIGDLNGDGLPDLVTANFNSSSVSVLLNTTAPGATTPSLAARQDFTTGITPSAVAIGDFNGDGIPDLVTANRDANSVSVLLNTTAPGAATLTFAAHQDFATQSSPRSVAIGDLNGDGLPDLAVANSAFNANSVSVLLNTTAPGATTPSFAAHQDFTTGINPFSVAIVDLNGDGKRDLAVANSGANTVSVLLNTTAPGATTSTFAASQDFTTAGSAYSVAIGDLNGDGRPDLAVANRSSNNVSVLLNNPVTIVRSTATGTITESDSPTTVQFSVASETVDENTTDHESAFSVTVSLSAVSSTDTTVPFTLSGTAERGTDYDGVTASPLVIAAGQTTGTITGTLIDDGSPDAVKTLTFTLGTPTNATLGSIITNTLTIGEVAGIVATGVAVNGFERSALTGVTVATFTDGDGTQPADDFSATIDWGDGNTSAGTVTRPQTTYIVQGSHTYTDERTYPISVVITGPGATATVGTTGLILEELLPDGTRGTPNERFISEVYRDLLRRQVDPGGLAYWSGQLDAGMSTLQVAIAIENDPGNEFRGIEVQDLYSQYLHRMVEPLALNGCVAFLRSGGTVEQLGAFLAGSDEYFRSRGGSSNQSWEDAITQDALARPIDPTARAFMESAFAQGMSRTEITATVLSSQEYRLDLIESIYMRYLDRNTDPIGMNNDLNALNGGWTDERVIAGTIGEPTALNEFFNKTAP
jgi:hypothetical protein